jgi:hypothetical protein
MFLRMEGGAEVFAVGSGRHAFESRRGKAGSCAPDEGSWYVTTSDGARPPKTLSAPPGF